MTLHCRPIGRGNHRLIVIRLNQPADLFSFQVEDRFTWGRPPRTLRIVRILL